MGCCSSADQKPVEQQKVMKPSKLTTIEKKEVVEQARQEPPKLEKLKDFIFVPRVHPCMVTKFKFERVLTEEEKAQRDEGDRWQCNGSELFIDGCKGGIDEYDFHETVNGWSCPDNEHDFDICEACVRFIQAAGKTGELPLREQEDGPQD